MRKRIVVLARGDGVKASDLTMLAEFLFMRPYWYFGIPKRLSWSMIISEIFVLKLRNEDGKWNDYRIILTIGF